MKFLSNLLSKRSLVLWVLSFCAVVAMAQNTIVLDFSKQPSIGQSYVEQTINVDALTFETKTYLRKRDYVQIQRDKIVNLKLKSGSFQSVEIIYDELSLKDDRNCYATSSFVGGGKYEPERRLWTANAGETVTELQLTNHAGTTYIEKIVVNARSHTFEISERGYATLCLDFSYTIPVGLTAGIPTAVSGEDISYNWTYYTALPRVASSTPLLYKGTPGTYTIYETYERPKSIPSGNLLIGNPKAEDETYADNACVYYGLGEGTDGGYGFYRTNDAPDGHTIVLPPNRCALKLDYTTPSLAPTFLGLEGVVTGLSRVPSQLHAVGTVYNLQGQSMGTMAQWADLPHGLYIVNGKKVVK